MNRILEMLFWTRACVCIGAIVVLAEGFEPSAVWRRSGSAVETAAPAALAALCRSKPDTCMAVAATAVRAVTSPAPEPEPEPSKKPDYAHMRPKQPGIEARNRPAPTN